MPATQRAAEATAPRRPGKPPPLRAADRGAAKRDEAKAYIAAHLCVPELSVQQICDAIGITRSTLYRLFLDHGGIHAYIHAQRVEGATAMLLSPSPYHTITELAKMWQFSDTSHFIRAFKKHHGWPPQRYRVMHVAASANGNGVQS